ncbi:MAG: polyprenyl synthetase family protein, partial [Armatimonadota bacterium]
RRGGPAVHKLGESLAKKNFNYTDEQAKDYGRDLAILAGDLQHSLNVRLMCECFLLNGIKPEVVLSVIHLLESDVVNTLIEGEMLDIQYSKMPVEKLNCDDIMRMLWMKTGALLEFSARAGAMLALETIDINDKLASSLANFASSCGAAFQLQDDILGLTADEAKLGKPVGSDIKEGKKTTIVHFALEKADENQKKLILDTLGNRNASDNEVEKVKEIFISLGALDRTKKLMKTKIDEALLQLDILPESKYKELLKAWADFMTSRNH